MSTSVVPYNAKQQRQTSSAINATNDIEPPLDYSFFHTPSLENLIEEEPRIPLSPRKGKGVEQEVEKDRKSKSKCLRLNNNGISDLSKLETFIPPMFENSFSQLGWIDLSFNELTTIHPVLLQCENLQILYLHGNQIKKIDEVKQLEGSHSLRKLTLHGNPIENEKGYRSRVLTMLKQLDTLDFSRVTKADKKTAETHAKLNAGAKTKSKHQDDDD